MQDLRAAPRWSKTAGIVVLIVFGLVLIVAVFGLLALTARLDEQHKEDLDKARIQGRHLLGQVETRIEARLGGVISRAVGLDERLDDSGWELQTNASQDLRTFLEGQKHGSLASWILRIDNEGALRWLGGRYVLWMHPDRLRERAARHDGAGALQEGLKQKAGHAPSHKEALRLWTELATEHGLAFRPPERDPEGPSHLFGLGYALEMLKAAAEALAVAPDALEPATVRDVVLRAEEVRLLNGQRARLPRADYEAYVADLQRARSDVLKHAPSSVSEALRWELERFRSVQGAFARSETVSPRSHLVTARDIARRHAPRYLAVVPQASSLFGVYTRPSDFALIVGLDVEGVERLVDGELSSQGNAFSELGMVAEALAVGDDPIGPNGDPAVADVDFSGAIDVPRRLVIFQVGSPKGTRDKYTGVLFWALILLAGAGLSVGGYVIVRLLTREMRLAQLKADFVSNLSHELKTPITSISIFTEMLDEGKLTTPADQTEAFSVLAQEAGRLKRIVDRMIDVARGEARSSPYTLEPGDLNRTVLEAATRFRRIITEPGLDLDIQLHPGRLAIQMDTQALDDVVTNLLSNAWKYKRENRARITVRTVRRGRFAEVVVQDDGIGIPRAERRKVFDMFYRSEQLLTLPVAGTGLGLALVRSVVAGHRGRVRLDGAPGGLGSMFTVRLPLDRKAEEALADVGLAEPADVVSDASSDAPDAPPHGKVTTT